MRSNEPVLISAVIVLSLMVTSLCYCAFDRFLQMVTDALDARRAHNRYFRATPPQVSLLVMEDIPESTTVDINRVPCTTNSNIGYESDYLEIPAPTP